MVTLCTAAGVCVAAATDGDHLGLCHLGHGGARHYWNVHVLRQETKAVEPCKDSRVVPSTIRAHACALSLSTQARHVKLRDIDDLLSGGYDEHGELSGLTAANGAQRSPSPGMLRFEEAAAAAGSPLGAQGAGAGVAMRAGAAGEGSSGGPRSAQDTVVAASVELTERRSSGTAAAAAGGDASSDVGDGKVPASATPGGSSRVARPHSHSYESSDGGHDETTPLAKV